MDSHLAIVHRCKFLPSFFTNGKLFINRPPPKNPQFFICLSVVRTVLPPSSLYVNHFISSCKCKTEHHSHKNKTTLLSHLKCNTNRWYLLNSNWEENVEKLYLPFVEVITNETTAKMKNLRNLCSPVARFLCFEFMLFVDLTFFNRLSSQMFTNNRKFRFFCYIYNLVLILSLSIFLCKFFAPFSFIVRCFS